MVPEEEFQRLCREQGLPVTVQRRAVWEVLAGREDHPTADQIYDEVSTRLPGVARGTVYRILEAFGRIGLARKVCHPGAAARFETKTHRHHHMVCLECGKMVDLEDHARVVREFRDIVVDGFNRGASVEDVVERWMRRAPDKGYVAAERQHVRDNVEQMFGELAD